MRFHTKKTVLKVEENLRQDACKNWRKQHRAYDGRRWTSERALVTARRSIANDAGLRYGNIDCEFATPTSQRDSPSRRHLPHRCTRSWFAALIIIIIIIIIINDNVYGAILMTMVTARVHPVHLMNADWAPGGRQPSDQASRLGLW